MHSSDLRFERLVYLLKIAGARTDDIIPVSIRGILRVYLSIRNNLWSAASIYVAE